MLLNEIEDKLKDLYTGSEIIRLTNNYAEEIGKEVTYHVVGYNSKKEILQTLVMRGRLDFFEKFKN